MYDKDKYTRMNRWIGQTTEVTCAVKEYLENVGERERERLDHHVKILREYRGETRLPDSVSSLMDELLELVDNITE